MRRLVVALLTVFMVGSGSVSALALEASLDTTAGSPVGPSGRVEVSEAGFALTFADDWVLLTRESLLDDPLGEELAQAEPGLWELVSGAAARLEAGDALKLFATPSVPDGSTWSSTACLVEVQPSQGETLADIVEHQASVIEDQMADFLVHGPEVHQMALPAGEALRIDMAHDVGRGSWASTYFIVDDSLLYGLTCGAESPPEDRWLSIAETFEFLSAEE